MLLAGEVYTLEKNLLQSYALGLLISKFSAMIMFSLFYYYKKNKETKVLQELNYKWELILCPLLHLKKISMILFLRMLFASSADWKIEQFLRAGVSQLYHLILKLFATIIFILIFTCKLAGSYYLPEAWMKTACSLLCYLTITICYRISFKIRKMIKFDKMSSTLVNRKRFKESIFWFSKIK